MVTGNMGGRHQCDVFRRAHVASVIGLCKVCAKEKGGSYGQSFSDVAMVETIIPAEAARLTGLWDAKCFRAAPERALSVSVSTLGKRAPEGHRRETFPQV